MFLHGASLSSPKLGVMIDCLKNALLLICFISHRALYSSICSFSVIPMDCFTQSDVLCHLCPKFSYEEYKQSFVALR